MFPGLSGANDCSGLSLNNSIKEHRSTSFPKADGNVSDFVGLSVAITQLYMVAESGHDHVLVKLSLQKQK